MRSTVGAEKTARRRARGRQATAESAPFKRKGGIGPRVPDHDMATQLWPLQTDKPTLAFGWSLTSACPYRSHDETMVNGRYRGKKPLGRLATRVRFTPDTGQSQSAGQIKRSVLWGQLVKNPTDGSPPIGDFHDYKGWSQAAYTNSEFLL